MSRVTRDPGSALRPLLIALLVALHFGFAESAQADLFALHEVTAHFATPDGKAMANAEVRVFAPGNLAAPVATGRTDSDGKFVFAADRDGMWTAEARDKSEVARVMIRVGGPNSQPSSRVPPVVVLGGLFALLAMAWWYRVLRMRNRHRP